MINYSGNKKIAPLEPVCRKTVYHSREEAEDMIRHIEETRITKRIRAYLCPVCGSWHLTSRTEK